jgi:hypothetical protein
MADVLVADILKKAHRKFAKDTDYPEEGDEDRLVRLDHIDDGISEWEDMVKTGVYWPELMVTDYSLAFGGTGTDNLPTNFLSTYRAEEQPAVIVSGSIKWTEVAAKDGARMVQEGVTPYVFWIEGRKIRTLPAASGSIPFPYLKKATRYTTGEEVTPIEMSNPKFLEDYLTGKIFLDNDDDLGDSYLAAAKEKLDGMTYAVIVSPPNED